MLDCNIGWSAPRFLTEKLMQSFNTLIENDSFPCLCTKWLVLDVRLETDFCPYLLRPQDFVEQDLVLQNS